MQVTMLQLEMLYELLRGQAVTIREQQQEIQQLRLKIQMTPTPPNGHAAERPAVEEVS